jgi:hypothetical protein
MKTYKRSEFTVGIFNKNGTLISETGDILWTTFVPYRFKTFEEACKQIEFWDTDERKKMDGNEDKLYFPIQIFFEE